jgi:hypothetical protein
MRHPFDGVEGTRRRTFLGSLLSVAAGFFAARVTEAAAPPVPQASTEALHEEGGRPSTTAASEEGGRLFRPRNKQGQQGNGMTTEALHEEGGLFLTAALNEEGT